MSIPNYDEWMAAMKAAIEAPIPESDALTVLEFGALVGIERSHASKRLKAMVAQGTAEYVKKQIRRADGGVIWVPAYRLSKAQSVPAPIRKPRR